VSAGAAERAVVVEAVEEALADVGDGATVGIGGAVTAAHPMALVRELARRRPRGLTVVAPTAGLDVELLIAAGCVETLHTCYVGFEGVAAVGPLYRRAVEAGEIEVRDMDEGHCIAALRAASQRLPFMPWRGGVGTAYPELNEGIVAFADPLAGEELLAIPALPLDFALIYAELADEFGNARPLGTGNMDHLIGAAAERVIVQVDRVVSNDEIRREPERTWRWREARVVRAPFGTHPYSNAWMTADTEHLKEFAGAARDPEALALYMERFAGPEVDHDAYLEQIGIRRVSSLLV
jgi:glutaconate CoA-transferase subunit A